MPGSSSLRRASLLLALLLAAWPAHAGDLCRGGKPSERMVAFLASRIDRPGKGLSLDDALTKERVAADRARASAARYFLDASDERVRRMRESYTFLFPERIQAFYDLGVPVELEPATLALRYRELLWKHYIERFTTVEEAPGRDPYSIRFKVSLDLTLFCRYRQEIRDLVAR